ncbi:dTDP-4-dehydrorhamnose reductase [Flavonifractor sp. An100]|uniref:dTDP-4-dehydrorhamnose reductase n=1 Tax=Flavonifractor sp. An100 TaxID=1965538 RepID=UPI000B381E4F|nr:dTDP-4-dehydrorhamnose reductase [Flavonifractor sp. An100]OUQ81551.1 dTDP-4-dehydrorhamnose reductase [Flavonifractor sp. An100]
MREQILITGSSGLLGQEFRRFLPEENAIFCSHSQLDITKIEDIRQFMEVNPIKYIINCAANCNAEYLEEHPQDSYLINELAPHNLALVANEYGATLIHFSSDYVFNGKQSIPYIEIDQTSGLSVYGCSKERSEKDLLSICNSVVIFRTAWLFSEFGRDFVKTIKQLGSKQDLSVIFDQIGSPTYAGDLAKHVLDILPQIQQGTKEIYHLSNEGSCSWYDLAHQIVRGFDLNCKVTPIHTGEFPQKAKRPSYSVLDKSKVKSDFNLSIRHYSDALDECIWRIKNMIK